VPRWSPSHPLDPLPNRSSRGPYSLPSPFWICAICSLPTRLSDPGRPQCSGLLANRYLQGSTFPNCCTRHSLCQHYTLAVWTAIPWIQFSIDSRFISSLSLVRITTCSNFSSLLDKLSPGALEALIDTLSRFFSFAADFRPTNQIIGQTTHPSRCTYWFLVLPLNVHSPMKCWPDTHIFYAWSLTARVKGRKVTTFFHTASIYAGIISTSSEMRLSLFWDDFLRAVNGCRGDFPEGRSVTVMQRTEGWWEAVWGALKALGSSDTAFMSDSHVASDTMVAHRLLAGAHGRDGRGFWWTGWWC